MGYKIKFTEGGQKLYDHTVNYFVETLGAPHIALRWVKAVNDAKEKLKTSANAYRLCEDSKLAEKNLHVIHLKKYKYKILYKIDGDTIYIEAILHDRQLPEKWLH